MRILVTGATGFIGSKLVPALLDRGHDVRVLSRSAHRLQDRDWVQDVEIVEGDATDRDDLGRALADVDVAYYLLHSMDAAGNFAERDRDMARTFADAAAAAGVSRIVYLGGLHPDGELSPHLGSRVEVGQIFLDGPVPAVVLQAGVVLGSGSASYEMLRHLTERLPVMVAPRWLTNRIQPIAARDAVHWLAEAAQLSGNVNRTFDIGGPDVLTYEQMMQRYAELAGLHRRVIVTLPVLTPGLASHWVGLVTPVSAGVAKPLVGSLVHDAVCSEHDLEQLAAPPAEGVTSFEEAIRLALDDYDAKAWSRTLVRTGTAAATGAAAALGTWVTRRRR